jgi:hypothetical protein
VVEQLAKSKKNTNANGKNKKKSQEDDVTEEAEKGEADS